MVLTVRAPFLAAAMAALVPAEPPPATNTSASSVSSIRPAPHAWPCLAFSPCLRCNTVASAPPFSGHPSRWAARRLALQLSTSASCCVPSATTADTSRRVKRAHTMMMPP